MTHVTIIHGDSGEVLPEILDRIETRCLFWLDGHFSGGFTAKGHTDTPIFGELRAILAHRIKDHVILIDDARCFAGASQYPTLQELREFVSINGPCYNWSEAGDVIQLEPKHAAASAFPEREVLDRS